MVRSKKKVVMKKSEKARLERKKQRDLLSESLVSALFSQLMQLRASV